MAFVRVDPASIARYGETANEIFDGISRALDSLVQEAAGIDYQGENAFTFKSEVADMAVKFAEGLNTDMNQMSTAIQQATEGLLSSLGNMDGVVLDLRATEVAAPSIPPAAADVQVETDGLVAFNDASSALFAQIESSFNDHQSSLESTDWEGQRKEQAVSAVGSYTTDAITAVNDTKTQMAEFVTAQIDATLSADSAA